MIPISNSNNSILRNIVYMTGQGWAMETDQIIISIKDLNTIEWSLTDAVRQLEYLHMNQQTEFIIHNIEKNLETAIDNIEIVTSNQWSSRNQIETILLNIRNATYNTL